MVDRLIIINKDMWKKLSRTADTLKEVGHLLKDIRNDGMTLLLIFRGCSEAGVITMATGAPVRQDFRGKGREQPSLQPEGKGGKEVHAVERYMKIAGALGCDENNILFPFPCAIAR